YLFDATQKDVRKNLEGERFIIKDLLEESINLNKKLEQIIVDDYKAVAGKMGIKKQDEAGALEIAEDALSDLFLSMIMDKSKDGEYRLTLRLKHVKTRQTLYTKTIDFYLFEDAEPEIIEMSKSMFEYRKLDSSLYLDMRLCCLHPVNDFAGLVNPGPGISFRFGINNLFINYFTLAMETGYFRFTYLENSGDTIAHVPLFLVMGYRIHFLNLFSITPFAGGGADLIIVNHGTGKGFNLPENSQKNSLEKAVKTGIEAGFSISESTTIIFDAYYAFVFEQKRLDFVNIGLGIKIKL
ncbi:MAG: hypothetical protein GY754_37770, partial [bacterium]|nr:hypothetical protein [bacterium]